MMIKIDKKKIEEIQEDYKEAKEGLSPKEFKVMKECYWEPYASHGDLGILRDRLEALEVRVKKLEQILGASG